MKKRRRRVNNLKSRRRKNNLGEMGKGCEAEAEAGLEVAREEEGAEVEGTMRNQELAVKNTKRREDRIHSLTRNQVTGLITKSKETEMQGLLGQRPVINCRMGKDQETTTKPQDRRERKESNRKGDHIVVEAAEVEEVVEEAVEEVGTAQRPATVLTTRRSRRRIGNSERVKSLTLGMSYSLKSPPELHRCVLSQGRPN